MILLEQLQSSSKVSKETEILLPVPFLQKLAMVQDAASCAIDFSRTIPNMWSSVHEIRLIGLFLKYIKLYTNSPQWHASQAFELLLYSFERIISVKKTKLYWGSPGFGVKYSLWTLNVICPGITGVGQLWLASQFWSTFIPKKYQSLSRAVRQLTHFSKHFHHNEKKNAK